MEAAGGYQGVGPVPQVAHPAGVVDPAEHSVHPHAEPEGVSLRMVFHADIGKIDVPDLIQGVEIDEEGPVPDRKIPRHKTLLRPLSGRLELRARGAQTKE